MNKKLILYIKQNLIKGHSLDKIKEYLLIHGHLEEDINLAISKVSKDYEQNKILN